MNTLYNKRFKPKGYSKLQKARLDKLKGKEKEAATQFKPTWSSPFVKWSDENIKWSDTDHHDRS